MKVDSPATALVIAALAICGSPAASWAADSAHFQQTGTASHYGPELDGQKTATGERFNNKQLVGAHKTLPLGSKVRVTNLENKKRVTVRINDRGPYKRGRIIDLSGAAAKKLDIGDDGKVPVKIEKVE